MADLEELARINKEQANQIATLTQQVAYLKRQLFGQKSEKFKGPHPELFDSAALEPGKDEASNVGDLAEEAAPKGNANSLKRKRAIRKNRLPGDLPIVEEEIIRPEVLAAPDEYRRTSEEISDQLEKEPGYFYLKRTIRPNFIRLDDPFSPPIIAPARPTLIQNGFWGDGLLSEILTNKYLYHLPFDRQRHLYLNRYGIDLSPNTMGDAAKYGADLFGLVVDRMKVSMIAGEVIQADETPKTYLDPAEAKGSSKGFFWVYRGMNGEVVFDWQTDRKHHHLADWLGLDYQGVLQSDGYKAYIDYVNSQTAKGKKLRRAACLAHIRRKFEKSLEQKPQIAKWFLRVIGLLYNTEEDLRENKAPAVVRARIRQTRSRWLIKLLQKATLHLIPKTRQILPKSDLGRALRYAHGQWADMETYLEDGRVEIDNNLCENAIRPTAVGKKNDLFVGAPQAGERSAMLYSLLISAKAQGVDPQAYLRDLIRRLPAATTSDIDSLTPASWAAAHKAREVKRQQEQKENQEAIVA
jgi:transposase